MNLMPLEKKAKTLFKWKRLYKSEQKRVHIEISDDETKQCD